MVKHEIEAGVILVVAWKLGNLRSLACKKIRRTHKFFNVALFPNLQFLWT